MAPTDLDLAELAGLFERNGDPKEMAQLRWRYLENPTAGLWVDFAIDEDERVVGAYCVSPYRMRLGPEMGVGVQSLDTLVDESQRGKGLFTTLARSTYRRCASAGVSLVYGFPNDSSAPGFFGKLEWVRMDPVPFLVRPVRPGYFAERVAGERRLPDWLAKWRLPALAPHFPRDVEPRIVTRFDERYDALWNAFAGPRTIGIERSGSYLAWRVRAPFPGGYSTLAACRGDSLLGFVSFRLARKHGGTIGYLMELLYREAVVGTALARYAVREMSAGGADAILAWCLPHSPNRGAYTSAGFVPMPEQVRPIALHFGARALDTALDLPIGNRASWYLSYLDSDTV